MSAFGVPDEPVTTILLIDDHPLFLEAVRGRLQRVVANAVIHEAGDVVSALSAGPGGADFPVDLVLLDYHLPGVARNEGLAEIIKRFPGVPVAVMSGSASREDVRSVIAAGAKGFLPKTMAAAQFAAAVALLLSGGTYLPTDVLNAPPSLPAAPVDDETSPLSQRMPEFIANLALLTPREREVLGSLAEGLSNKEVGRRLGLSDVTIKLHVRQILKKTGTRNRSELTALATRAGMV